MKKTLSFLVASVSMFALVAPSAMAADYASPVPINIPGASAYGTPCAYSTNNAEKRRCRKERTYSRRDQWKQMSANRDARQAAFRKSRGANLRARRERKTNNYSIRREQRDARMKELQEMSKNNAFRKPKNMLNTFQSEHREQWTESLSERKSARRSYESDPRANTRGTIFKNQVRNASKRSKNRAMRRDAQKYLRVR